MTLGFDLARFEALLCLRSCTLGRPLTIVDVTPSTNDLALEAAHRGARHGATFVADAQTRGRGRQGRTWLANPGESLLCSVLLRPRIALERAPLLPLAVGLAARSVVNGALAGQDSGLVQLKWPNDVLVRRKKICGVLVESQVRGGGLVAAVVGVGLNVRCRDFPAELAAHATSLALLDASELDREPLLVELLAAIEHYLSGLETAPAAMIEELRRHDALLGCPVDVDGTIGVGCGIDPDGRLLVTDDQGKRHSLASGHVQVLDDGAI